MSAVAPLSSRDETVLQWRPRSIVRIRPGLASAMQIVADTHAAARMLFPCGRGFCQRKEDTGARGDGEATGDGCIERSADGGRPAEWRTEQLTHATVARTTQACQRAAFVTKGGHHALEVIRKTATFAPSYTGG